MQIRALTEHYKAQLYGKVSLQMNPQYTTQMCAHCSFRMRTCGTQKLTLDQRTWTCPCCGQANVRDYNAAKNILARGLNKYLQTTSESKRLQKLQKLYFQHQDYLSSKILGLPLLATH